MLWFLADRIDNHLLTRIQGDFDGAVASAASIWEIEIKRALGKLRVPEDLGDRCDRSGLDRLGISFEHAQTAGRLPPHHRDPFDRMLVAQARVEGLTLVTSDAALGAYDVPILEASEGGPGLRESTS